MAPDGADRAGRPCSAPLAVAGRRRWPAAGWACSPVAAACCWSCVCSTWRSPARCARCAAPRRRHRGAARARRPTVDAARHATRPAGRCAAACATPGRPSPGRAPQRHRVDVPAGRTAPARRPTLRPTRRGDRHGRRVTVRSLGPLGPRRTAGLARRARGRCACCRRSPRAGTCPPSWPGCASSTAARRRWSAARAPSSTRCGSTSPATTCAPSTGGPPPGAPTSSCAPGAPSATGACCSCSTPGRTSAGRVGDAPRLDAAMDAALLLAALASRAGDRVDLLAYDRGSAPRVRGAGRRGAAARAGGGDGAAGAGAGRDRPRRPGQHRAAAGAAALPGRPPHGPRPRGRRGGPAARWADWCTGTRWSWPRSATPGSRRWRADGATRRRCTRRPRPRAPSPSAVGSPSSLGRHGVEVVDARPTSSRPRWPTVTSPSRRPAASSGP